MGQIFAADSCSCNTEIRPLGPLDDENGHAEAANVYFPLDDRERVFDEAMRWDRSYKDLIKIVKI